MKHLLSMPCLALPCLALPCLALPCRRYRVTEHYRSRAVDMGSEQAKTTATGSAGGANSQNANASLEKCDTSLGTLAIVEDTSAPWYRVLTGQMKLGSTTPVLKLLAQQSNCFVVVERGRAMNNMG